MIEATIEKWHRLIRGDLPGGLDELLHDDVVFHSPVVFTPQQGKEITSMYLLAAFSVLAGGAPLPDESIDPAVAGPRAFRYVKETMAGNHACLEFETEVDGKYVNGVDLITCDDDGKITEFKVMVRPLQAINALHDRMRALLT